MSEDFLRDLTPDHFAAMTPLAVAQLPPHVFAVSALVFFNCSHTLTTSVYTRWPKLHLHYFTFLLVTNECIYKLL